MAKYSVLSYNFAHYEVVREVLCPSEDVEYILVTDDETLTSKTWKVIVDHDLDVMTTFQKCYAVRFNLFKYATTDVCVYLDASIQIKQPLDAVINDFLASGSDIGLLCHPFISTYGPELNVWISQRQYPVKQAEKVVKFLQSVGYDFSYKSHFQNGIQIRKRGKDTEDYQRLTLSHLMYIGTGDIERNDQLMSDYVLNRYFSWMKVFLMSLQCLESPVLQIYKHGTYDVNHIGVEYDLDVPTYAYCFNQLQKCYYMR